jgi:hypothetical protein
MWPYELIVRGDEYYTRSSRKFPLPSTEYSILKISDTVYRGGNDVYYIAENDPYFCAVTLFHSGDISYIIGSKAQKIKDIIKKYILVNSYKKLDNTAI